ncbi:hypothetical protein TK45_00440 [Bowmanella sp. JS7-9]|nr:hypothetical protein TK45_00440 [Bowmanella sp. JS7-9]
MGGIFVAQQKPAHTWFTNNLNHSFELTLPISQSAARWLDMQSIRQASFSTIKPRQNWWQKLMG